MLNPIWLHTFKTLIDVGHFTKTAELLHMTQPGVSQHVNKLESACGYTLINRFNKSFELTVHGRKVYDYAVSHFSQECEFLQGLAHDEPFRGRCAVGCSGTLSWLLYSPLLTFQENHPGLSIEIEAAPNHSIFDQIRQGQIDIGLVTKKPNPKYFSSRVVGTEWLSLILPISANESLPLNELLNELGVIRHPDMDHYFQTYVEQTGNKYIKQVKLADISTKSYINQVHQILVPVSKGIGFTVVPHWCFTLFPENEKLKIYDAIMSAQESIFLVSKVNYPLAKRYDCIINIIEQTLGDG